MRRPPPDTERIVGLAAAAAAVRVRPQDVLNIAHARAARREVKHLLRAAAQHRIAYREVESDELERLADTVHHEGVCILARQRAEVRIPDLIARIHGGGLLLALDRVENPHNIGGLLRSAAYFGAKGLIAVTPKLSSLPPSAVRVAEGGAEYVPTCLVGELAGPLTELRAAGIAVIGADAGGGTSATEFRFPRRAVLVLGSERHGLAPEVKQRCSDLIHIPGTDAVESLNVSVAAGILLAFATRPPGARAP